MTIRRIVIVLALAISMVSAARLFAYDGETVKNGGTIEGIVKFKGTAPAAKKVQVTKDAEVCGKTAKTDSSLVINNGNVAEAVVFIEDIIRGKPMLSFPRRHAIDSTTRRE